MNAFPVQCKTCGARILMDRDQVTKKWRPVNEEGGELVSHFPACEEAMRKRAISRAKDERQQHWLDLHPEVKEKARARAIVRKEAAGLDAKAIRQVKAADGFEDDIPWGGIMGGEVR